MSIQLEVNNSYLNYQKQQINHIDRQRSLRIVGLAEKSLEKKRQAISHFKHPVSEQQIFKNTRTSLINQIEEKLSWKDHPINQYITNTSNNEQTLINKRMNRLQELLQNIKQQRLNNQQSKSHLTQQAPSSQPLIIKKEGKHCKRERRQ